MLCFQQSGLEGLHYIFNSSVAAESCSDALMRGGGCGGRSKWSWWSKSICSGSGCV